MVKAPNTIIREVGEKEWQHCKAAMDPYTITLVKRVGYTIGEERHLMRAFVEAGYGIAKATKRIEEHIQLGILQRVYYEGQWWIVYNNYPMFIEDKPDIKVVFVDSPPDAGAQDVM